MGVSFAAASVFGAGAQSQSCDTDSCPAVKVYGEGVDAICRAWATEAVGQQLENEQRSCGESSDDWHFDIKRHFRTCRGLNQTDRDEYSEARANKLRDCRQSPPVAQAKPKAGSDAKTPEWDEYCRKSYMVDAMRMARRAKDTGCTKVDPELHQSKERHYSFCVREAPGGAGDYPLHDLIGDRQEKIEECAAKAVVKTPPTREMNSRRRACSRFADIFLNAMLENERLGCEMSGDDWHTKWNTHYTKCADLKRSDRLRLITARQSELKSCRAKVFPKGQLESDDPDDAPDAKISGKEPSKQLRAACTAYAKDAIAHQAANQQLGCGFSGPLWNIKEITHFNACTSQRADYAFRSNMSRDAKLRQCTAVRLCRDEKRSETLYCKDLTGNVAPAKTPAAATKSPAKKLSEAEANRVCGDYVDLVKADLKVNREKKCGFTGSLWDPDEDNHFASCKTVVMKDGEAGLEDAKTQRRDKLADCNG